LGTPRQPARPGVGRSTTGVCVEAVRVGKRRDLSKLGLGDSIWIQLAEAVAISVVNP
jgi:hypothetical protein